MVASRKRSLEFISDESKRRSTLKKRKLNVFKKAHELSTLCGVKTCVILYTPDEPNPEIWPNPNQANEMLARFNAMSDEKKKTKMTDSERILRKPIEKMQKELAKIQAENRKLELQILLHECLKGKVHVKDLGRDDVAGLTWLVDAQIKVIKERKEKIQSAQFCFKNEGNKSDELGKKEIGSSESCGTDGEGDDVAKGDGPTCMQLFPMSTMRNEVIG